MRVEFKQVFDKWRENKRFDLDTWGYNICIHAFGCWADLVTSLRLFKEMKEKSLAYGESGPDLCTYNSLIHVLCMVGKVKDALVVWEELKVSGHEPDAFTYRFNGFAPDTIVYNSLLDGLFKARKIAEACQLFEQMVQDGVRTSCWTYNILIDGLFRNGRPEAGCTLFCDLKKKGQFVDAITYSIVILQLCREGLLEEALELVEEMEARGFVVDLITITSLLIGFHKQGKWDWAERLMKHIRDGNLVPHILKWKANLDASIKNPPNKREDYSSLFPTKGSFSDIVNLVGPDDQAMNTNLGSENDDRNNKEISSTETDQWSSSPSMDQLANQVKPDEQSSHLFSLKTGQRVQAKQTDSFDVDMVNTFLSIFLSKGKLSLACKLFEIFTDMGVNPVNYTYNSIMSSFVKKGYLNEAWGVLSEMEEKICPADIATYNLIIQGLGKMGRADIANSVLDKLMKQGGYLDIVMYNTLINALGKTGRVDEASKLFEQMRTSGINPDVVTYNILIEVHTKAGRLKDAYKLQQTVYFCVFLHIGKQLHQIIKINKTNNVPFEPTSKPAFSKRCRLTLSKKLLICSLF
ncbi:hypothetical protein SLEP1_g56172 [Rubroshorea leprosula]|uniref:Pentatricopeptide repeat-containing protein n=1 Tax=Rubroshorea leprosula TaxID=152421 RepID=A0AAV5MLW1_9ROSI|nr:hypothetical protein SLEP1_g56172 [Rubroshorea leprosula]